MAFATQDDVFAVLEDVLPPIFAKYGKYDRASGAPFMRIPYTEAMEKYGSDKPDLRIDLTVEDITEEVTGCGFGPFEGAVVKAVGQNGDGFASKSACCANHSGVQRSALTVTPRAGCGVA